MKLRRINHAFRCAACGADVSARADSENGPGGIRNHCPFCLVSLHVDEQMPGDRGSGCGGLMPAVGLRQRHGDRQILQKCQTCGARHWNVVAPDDDIDLLGALPAA